MRHRISNDDESFDIHAYIGLHGVGYANCVMDSQRLIIADIHVTEEIPRPWPWPLRFLEWFGRTRPLMRLRGRGIGSELLRRAIAEGTARGATEAYGEVTAEGLAGTPYLLDWYAHHGFTARNPDGPTLAGAVKIVSKKMV